MKFNKSTLNEETLKQAIDTAEKQVDNAQVVKTKGDIETALDRALKASARQVRKGGKEFVNVLLVGEAGTGKTARVFNWASENGINIYNVDAKTLDITDLGGAISPNDDRTAVNRLATTELDALNRPNSVLFLDEFNRADSNIRGTLLTLINDHQIRDAREESGYRFFPNFLFTIAAINPPNGNYNTDELDGAELSRFYKVDVALDTKNNLAYLEKKFTKELDNTDDPEEATEVEGRLKIARTLLKHPDFEFDDAISAADAQRNQVSPLNPRSLAKLLELCDGTKDDFLDLWDGQCNPAKKSMAERILANYKDVENKANSVFNTSSDTAANDDEEVPEFMKGPSLWDKVQQELKNQGLATVTK